MRMVELPYGNQAFHMVVLLPKPGKKLTDINALLRDGNTWGNLNRGLRSAMVDLQLPRFQD